MNIMTIIWIALAVILAIIEAFTVSLVTIWGTIGAVAASIAASLGADVWIQAVIFIAVSALLIFLTRPLAKKLLKSRTEATNSDRLIGKTALVIADIDQIDNKGQIKVMGQVWSASEINGSAVEKGAEVIIEKIQGVRAVVRRKEV